jgi:dicarboxylate transporter 10
MPAKMPDGNNKNVVGGKGGVQGAVTGGIAAIMATSITHPFDLLKVRSQMLGEGERLRGEKGKLVRIFRNIYSTAGIFGFYRGLSAAILRQSVFSTSRFGIYEQLKTIFNNARMPGNTPGTGEKLLHSVFAGCVAATAACPFDLLNTRMQADARLPPHLRLNYGNAISGFIRVVKEEGFFSLWNGCAPNILRGTIVTTFQFVGYDASKSALLLYGNNVINRIGFNPSPNSSVFRTDAFTTHLCASLVTSILVCFAACPADILRTRMMNAKAGKLATISSGLSPSDGIVKFAHFIYKTEGLCAFYKGLLPYFMRAGPQVCCCLLCIYIHLH